MADAPKRIQLSRKKGWRMPENTVSAARPGVLGNPFTVKLAIESEYARPETAAAFVVRCFREWLPDGSDEWWQGPHSDARRAKLKAALPGVRGKNLACWCRLCEQHRDGKPFDVDCPDCAPCHADVLLELANSEITNEGPGAANNRSGDIQR